LLTFVHFDSHLPRTAPVYGTCYLRLKSSHRPDGRLTFCSLFAGRRCVCQWWHSVNRELPDLLQHSYLGARSSSKVPIAPIGKWLTCPNRLSSFNSDRSSVLPERCTCQPRLQTSHCPDGIFTCFALVLAGRRCVHLQWDGNFVIVHHHWQHSWRCACQPRLQTSHRPMGKLLTRLL
jgi:hypothetical protein